MLQNDLDKLKTMKKMMGIDVSKDTLDFVVLNVEDHGVQQRGVVLNNKKDINKWLERIDSSQVVVALEHTGHYAALLAWILSEKDFTYYMITPYDLKRSMGIQRGKTDAIDAYRIASYAITQKHRLSPYLLPTKALRELKVMMAARDRYVKISVQLQNSLKSNEILMDTLDVKLLIREEKKQIRSLKLLISKIEKEMINLMKEDPQLKTSYQRITKVIGVGPITAIKCIIETNDFTSFTKARKFSCYCGLAPFPYQSGSSIRGNSRTHFLRNKNLKSILFRAASTAIQHDPQLKTYYRRKLDQGKHKLSALNAVANKLVMRIFAVANREEPFVKLAA